MQQLDVALAAARSVGGASVPLLPAEERESYVRAVCSAEGLTALAAAVVRNTSSTLKASSRGVREGMLLGAVHVCPSQHAADYSLRSPGYSGLMPHPLLPIIRCRRSATATSVSSSSWRSWSAACCGRWGAPEQAS